MRNNPEHRIHTKAVAYLRRGFARLGYEHAPLFHTPNESNVPPQYRAKLKRLGVSPGVPDLIIVSPTPEGAGAALEIKAPRGRLSTAQRRWLETWSMSGFDVACTRGHAETADTLRRWGYITDDDCDQWIAWAQQNDHEAL